MMSDFASTRRQNHISEETCLATLKHYDTEEAEYERQLLEVDPNPGGQASTYQFRAASRWEAFQLKYTAGEPFCTLVPLLEKVVAALEDYVEESSKEPDASYIPALRLNDLIDAYVDYLNLLSVAVLLHREDLIPRIYALIEGSVFDEGDAVIEELLKFFLPDRPALDYWIWDQPYRKLLDAIDEEDEAERAKLMKKYVGSWYKSMKGKAAFWGAHERIENSLTPYHGYWAMCCGAFTYLYGIDDASYRNETVYPKDLVDYARSVPRNPVIHSEGELMLRVIGGDRCVKEGIWSTPAQQNSARHFLMGEIMPAVESAEYGTTIWQWQPT
jgi:hypothetical protein